MPIMNGCCCFVQLRNGSRASAVFTAVVGVLNVMIDIWMLVKLHRMSEYLEANEAYIWMPPGILVFLYLELACNLGVIGLSMLLWVGINYGYDGKGMVFGWVWGMASFRFYEFFLMVYALIWIGAHRISDIVYVVPESYVVTFYWVVNTLILLAALLCVVSYWQELVNSLYGKEKRRSRYYKISNIRAANRFPGTATPSQFGSRMTLASTMASRQQSVSTARPYPSQSSGSFPIKA